MLKMSIRGLAAGALIASLSACTAVFSDVVSTWQYATEKREGADLSAEQISEFPYTALYMQRGSSPRALVVLGFVDEAGGKQSGSPAYFNWITAERETLVTQHGRLVRTSDVSPELLGRTGLETDPLDCFIRTLQTSGFSGLDNHACDGTWNYVMDIENEDIRFSVATQSEFSFGSPQVISLPQANVEVVKVTEQVHFSRSRAGAAQTVSNQFWIEQDGHVVKSIQHIAPQQSPFEVTQVKWVGRDYE